MNARPGFAPGPPTEFREMHMQYALKTDTTPDLAAIGQAIAALDPAMLLDLDASGRTLRLSTCATRDELLACLDAAGVADADRGLVQLPSECCGGCGG